MNKYIGIRRDLTDDYPLSLTAGEYGKEQDGSWYCHVPNHNFFGGVGSLRLHAVVENPDGTITVSPSILVKYWDEQTKSYRQWHGYLKNGIFEDA